MSSRSLPLARILKTNLSSEFGERSAKKSVGELDLQQDVDQVQAFAKEELERPLLMLISAKLHSLDHV